MMTEVFKNIKVNLAADGGRTWPYPPSAHDSCNFMTQLGHLLNWTRVKFFRNGDRWPGRN